MDNNDLNIEAKLIEQEHRTIKILCNFYNYHINNKSGIENDPRKPASASALIWEIIGFKPIFIGISTVSVILTIFALYTAIEANSLISKQNLLIEEDRKSSYLPHIYLESEDYTFVIPEEDSSLKLSFGLDKNYSSNVASFNYKIRHLLPSKITNLGKGSAKNIEVSFNFPRDTVIRELNKYDQVKIKEKNGKIIGIKFPVNSLFIDKSVDWLTKSKTTYVLPEPNNKNDDLIYIDDEYTHLFSAYLWLKSNKLLDDKYVFPSLNIKISYLDIENFRHIDNFEFSFKESFRIYVFEDKENKIDGHWLYTYKSKVMNIVQ